MNEQPPKPRRGCFFYGCITGLVLLLVIAIGGLVAVHYAKKAFVGLINEYTDTQPMKLPAVQMPPAEVKKLKQRFEAFEEAVKAKRPTPPLVLTADEINALIASEPDKKSLKGKMYVSFEGDRVKGQLSLPLHDIGWKMFKNRYLNGSGTFNVRLQNGLLFVAPQTIEVKGKQVPDAYMQVLRAQNFAEGLTNQPNATAVMQGLEDIQVKDGKLIVIPKERPEAEDLSLEEKPEAASAKAERE